jgi:hypothetical protein
MLVFKSGGGHELKITFYKCLEKIVLAEDNIKGLNNSISTFCMSLFAAGF